MPSPHSLIPLVRPLFVYKSEKTFPTGNYLQELPCSNYLHDKKTWKPFKNHSVYTHPPPYIKEAREVACLQLSKKIKLCIETIWVCIDNNNNNNNNKKKMIEKI